MIKWFKRSQEIDTTKSQNEPNDSIEKIEKSISNVIDQPETTKTGFFSRLKSSLTKTRDQLGTGVGRLLLGKKEISAELIEELEALLISSDLGINTTQQVLENLTSSLERKKLVDGDAVYSSLKVQLKSLLDKNNVPLCAPNNGNPLVILMVGINGAGKTTTIGKLAKQFQAEGKRVMLAAGDTFRAAAVEQLQVWGERNDITVIAQHTGADSASVIFDAFQAAKARNVDVLIADTAGRLHTQSHLMNELKKVKRVLQKIDPQAPHETMLVLDASIGQNALVQAKQFHEAVELTGITMTKLDGTAKGGILFAIASELNIPFRYIGIGEGINDLRPFDAEQFVSALFS